MLQIRVSKAADPNSRLRSVERKKGQDNLKWLGPHLPKEDDGVLRMLLVGGTDPLHFRLRVAQSHVRHDMSPSHFSHVALLAGSKLWECALDPRRGFGYPPDTNGLRTGALADYADENHFPNICLLKTTAQHEQVMGKNRIKMLQRQRAAIDLVALVHAWLGYAWGVGDSVNPLLRELGIPCAAAAETLLANWGIDLTPAVSARASCPEAIWQAARWWHLPADVDKDLKRQALSGVFHVEDKLTKGRG